MRLEEFANLWCLRGTHGIAAGVDEAVGIGIVFQQQLDHFQVATPGRGMQGRAAFGPISVRPGRICAAFQQQVDDLETAEVGGGIERTTIVGTLLGDA